MENKTFFEYLCIADMERIHSQILAWIFSKDFNAINPNDKKELLKKIFQLENISDIKNVITESNKIDITIETETEILIIENKIKSSQHSNQLSRYEEFCEINYPNNKKRFYYLTLIDEESKTDNWKRISYVNIFKFLKDLKLKNANNHSVVFEEYLNYLEKLTNVLLHFQENTRLYDMVFLDGKKKKSEKVDFKYQNVYEKFIAENQLETILQKCFLNSISNKINEVESWVMETRGDALIDFKLRDNIFLEGNNYITIIELQGTIIKFAFIIEGEKYNKSEKKWIKDIIPKMQLLATNNRFGYSKCNEPKSKAYVSISKKLHKYYWHMNEEELINFINSEIRNGMELTDALLDLIN